MINGLTKNSGCASNGVAKQRRHTLTDTQDGQRLNWLRRIAGMKLDAVSAATGISTPQLCGMELGKRTISDRQMALVSAVLLPAAQAEAERMKRLEVVPA